jgi:sugar lactone lactonase YvrE
MKKFILSIAFLAFFILALAPLAGGLYAQSGTIAPNYITVPSIAALPTCAVPDKGKTVFNSGDNKMYYCDGTAWQAMSGGAGGGALSLTANNIANTTGGNFGIGTNTPSNKLEINSGVPNKTGLKFTTMTSAAGPLASSTQFVNSVNTRGLAIDNAGNVYATEQNTNKIIKITPAGTITTLVSSGLSTPWDITFGLDSNLYVCNNGANTVSKVITTTGIVSTYAAGFTNPTGLCFDNVGNMFVVNAGNGNLSKVTPLGASITYSFGTGLNQGSGCVFSPLTNKIYIGGNTSNEVSQIDASIGGAKTTFVSGYNSPSGINIDVQGNLYVCLAGLSKVIKITPTSVVTDLFISANPTDIVFDSKNNFYIGNVLGFSGGSIDTYTETYPNVLSINPSGEVVKTNKQADLWVKDGTSIRNTNSGGFWSETSVVLDGLSTNVSNPPTAPVNGASTRMMWIPARSAFRVGTSLSDKWDASNIGLFSLASGFETIASGRHSTAMGVLTKAYGEYSTAMGRGSYALGENSTVMGFYTNAVGIYSTAMGYYTSASGDYSTAMGRNNTPNLQGLFMVGNGTNSIPYTSFIIRKDNNRVGIGVENPLAVLHIGQNSVNNSISSTAGTFFGNTSTSLSTFTTTSSWGPSILAEQAIISKTTIAALQNVTASDSRIKNIVGVSNNSQDLEKLRKLEITDYTMKDVATWGNKAYKKVIAQQVESVYPQAITTQTAVIPDIYTLAQTVSYNADNKELTVNMASNYALKVGDKLEVVHPERGKIQSTIAAINGNSFTLKDWQHPTDKLFVFGREVSDFRTVDYEALSMLGISAIQALAKENDKKSITIDELRAYIEKLRITNDELRASKTKVEARLDAIENLLKANVPSGK